MHTRVLHVDRRWPKAPNHMDCRVCPDCGATVNGRAAQHVHMTWHEELAELLEDHAERLGASQEQSGIPWTAAVDEEDQGELEASG